MKKRSFFKKLFAVSGITLAAMTAAGTLQSGVYAETAVEDTAEESEALEETTEVEKSEAEESAADTPAQASEADVTETPGGTGAARQDSEETAEESPEEAVSDGFHYEDGSYVYYKNGNIYTNEQVVYGEINGTSAWYYINSAGVADLSFNGFAKNNNGWWYIENGKVTFTKSEVTQGTVNGESGWWNVKGSKVIFNESIEPNKNGWWYLKNGKVDFTKTSVEHNAHGWWYVKNGKVDFGYTGVRNNKHGWWYIKNGKVDFNYNGLASNENGTWVIVNGKVDFGANGTRTIGGTTYTVSGGKVTGKVDSVQAAMIAKARGYTTSTGYMILVDRASCKVGIFRGSGSSASLDKYWSCCVGAPSTPTITGVYKLGSKGLYFNTGTSGRCWYYSQIKGDYLFHSVIYDRSSSPVNIIDGTMGAHVSHGCVRLNVNNAKYIYASVPSGSTIVVYN